MVVKPKQTSKIYLKNYGRLFTLFNWYIYCFFHKIFEGAIYSMKVALISLIILTVAETLNVVVDGLSSTK
jgi:hypothetical protein